MLLSCCRARLRVSTRTPMATGRKHSFRVVPESGDACVESKCRNRAKSRERPRRRFIVSISHFIVLLTLQWVRHRLLRLYHGRRCASFAAITVSRTCPTPSSSWSGASRSAAAVTAGSSTCAMLQPQPAHFSMAQSFKPSPKATVWCVPRPSSRRKASRATLLCRAQFVQYSLTADPP